MRAQWDLIGNFREVTKRMSNSPSATFMCNTCLKGKSILGRRKIGMIGRRTLYACAMCQTGK